MTENPISEYIDHAARAAFTGEAEPVPGALRARIEADGAVKALRDMADRIHAEADRIEREGHL